jgi:hypothetical protein
MELKSVLSFFVATVVLEGEKITYNGLRIMDLDILLMSRKSHPITGHQGSRRRVEA